MTVSKNSNNLLNWSKEEIENTPRFQGVYVLRNFPTNNGIIYIGSTSNLHKQLTQHWLLNDIEEVKFFDWYQTDNEETANAIKKILIEKFSPKYNNIGE